MTQVIEGEMKVLLERVVALAKATAVVADGVVSSAARYQKADERSEQAIASVAAGISAQVSIPRPGTGASERGD